MFGYSVNQILNILILLLPIVILFIVLLNKRDQKIDIENGQCARSWERLLAFLIDISLCVLTFYCITIAIKKVGFNLDENFEEGFFFVLSWFYFAGLESSKRQATLGKIIEGIIVTDLNGNRLTFWRASIRFVSTIISDMAMFVGHIMIAFTRYKQGLHDMLTNTLVLKKNFKENKDTPESK